MSRLLSQLLDQPEHVVAKAVRKLEDKNGYPSHDVRLMAETIQKIRTKLSDLKLDPDDTTGEELYHALLVKFVNDSAEFEKSLAENTQGFDEKANLAKRLINKHVSLPDCWALKSTVAKKVLRDHPPKRLMKHLRYRSVDSMLKRENIAELYLALPQFESASWTKLHLNAVSRLDPTSFEPRQLSICALPYKKWVGFGGPDLFVARDLSMGAIAVWPSRILADAPLLTLLLIQLETLASFKQFKLSQATAAIGQSVAWWADMDHLIANLDSERVSLNLKDVALNHLRNHSYDERLIDRARISFWDELLSRYENQTEVATGLVSEANLSRTLNWLRAPDNQPAFEFVEDI